MPWVKSSYFKCSKCRKLFPDKTSNMPNIVVTNADGVKYAIKDATSFVIGSDATATPAPTETKPVAVVPAATPTPTPAPQPDPPTPTDQLKEKVKAHRRMQRQINNRTFIIARVLELVNVEDGFTRDDWIAIRGELDDVFQTTAPNFSMTSKFTL